jgi:UMF1 family MFS transporter
MASFIPITLEQLARERGWVEGNRSQSCKAGLEMPDSGYRNSTAMARPPHEVRQCIIDIFGFEINTASFAMYTFSISVLVQALLIISISAAADHGKFRRKLLVIFAFVGSIATMLFLPVVPEYLGWGAILAIIANTAFGASFVLLNSFLPLLVRHHPSVQELDAELSDGEDVDAYEVEEDGISYPTETSSLLNRTQPVLKPYYPPPPVTTSRELHISTKISSSGIGIGYIAALIVQAASIVTVRAMKSSLLSLRVALFMIGAWWFVFTIPAAMWLRSRPGPPLHLSPHQSRFGSGWAYFVYSWKSLWRSVKQARRLKDCLLFLGAWFLLSDAIATVSGTAILFAKTSLEMQPAALALITVTATLSGIVGAFSWSRVSNMMGLKPTHTIMACILLFEVIPIYGLLGYIPAVRRWGVIGLQQPWEM